MMWHRLLDVGCVASAKAVRGLNLAHHGLVGLASRSTTAAGRCLFLMMTFPVYWAFQVVFEIAWRLQCRRIARFDKVNRSRNP